MSDEKSRWLSLPHHLLRCILGLVGATLYCASLLAQTVVVGDVTLVIGSAHVQRGNEKIDLSRGVALQAGDSIQTLANGHVHVRFVDGALVSVRPASQLRIVEYRYDKFDPASSVIRLQLDQGVVRAISGQAAELAKDRFRLNTPLAAIGIKGTDFVVEVDRYRVNTIVNQGLIVLAPLDQQCRAEGLGPCNTASARELSAALRGMALSYSAMMLSPQLLPVAQIRGSELLSVPAGPLSSNGTRTQQAAQIDSYAVDAVDKVLNNASYANTLIWGRWGGTLPQDNLTVAFSEAMKNRAVTVGDGYYFLFRKEVGVPNLLGFDQGLVNFKLQSSDAYYLDRGNERSGAFVQGGTLGVNFSTHTFQTRLEIDAAQTPGQAFVASGKLNPITGIFLANPGTASVAGALSLDSRQAGYVFSVPSNGGGVFKGATLWGR